MAAICTDVDVGDTRLVKMGMGSCFCGRGWAWAIAIVAVNDGDIVLVVNGGGTWGGFIRGLMLVVGVRCTPSGTLRASLAARFLLK